MSDQQAQELPSQDYVRGYSDGLSAAAILAARARVPVERPDEDSDAAIIEWFVRMQGDAEASYVIEAAAEAIANADGWDWHDDDYKSPDPKWEPTDKAEYRETARKALAAARRAAAARLPEQPDEVGKSPTRREENEAAARAGDMTAKLGTKPPTVPEEPDEGRKARLVEKSRALAAGEPCPSCGMRHADPLDLLEEPGA